MDKCLLWKDGDRKYEYEGMSLLINLPDEVLEFTSSRQPGKISPSTKTACHTSVRFRYNFEVIKAY